MDLFNKKKVQRLEGRLSDLKRKFSEYELDLDNQFGDIKNKYSSELESESKEAIKEMQEIQDKIRKYGSEIEGIQKDLEDYVTQVKQEYSKEFKREHITDELVKMIGLDEEGKAKELEKVVGDDLLNFANEKFSEKVNKLYKKSLTDSFIAGTYSMMDDEYHSPSMEETEIKKLKESIEENYVFSHSVPGDLNMGNVAFKDFETYSCNIEKEDKTEYHPTKENSSKWLFKDKGREEIDMLIENKDKMIKAFYKGQINFLKNYRPEWENLILEKTKKYGLSDDETIKPILKEVLESTDNFRTLNTYRKLFGEDKNE